MAQLKISFLWRPTGEFLVWSDLAVSVLAWNSYIGGRKCVILMGMFDGTISLWWVETIPEIAALLGISAGIIFGGIVVGIAFVTVEFSSNIDEDIVLGGIVGEPGRGFLIILGGIVGEPGRGFLIILGGIVGEPGRGFLIILGGIVGEPGIGLLIILGGIVGDPGVGFLIILGGIVGDPAIGFFIIFVKFAWKSDSFSINGCPVIVGICECCLMGWFLCVTFELFSCGGGPSLLIGGLLKGKK